TRAGTPSPRWCSPGPGSPRRWPPGTGRTCRCGPRARLVKWHRWFGSRARGCWWSRSSSPRTAAGTWWCGCTRRSVGGGGRGCTLTSPAGMWWSPTCWSGSWSRPVSRWVPVSRAQWPVARAQVLMASRCSWARSRCARCASAADPTYRERPASRLPPGVSPRSRAFAKEGRGRSADQHAAALHPPAFARQAADLLHQLGTLGDLDPLGEGLLGVLVQHRHRGLGDDHAGVHSVVDHEQGGAGDLHAVLQRVPGAVDTGKGGQQRVVRVLVTAAERGEELRADELEDAGRDHQVRLVL